MRDAKFRILLLDTKFRNPNHYICVALRDALRRARNVEFVIKADPRNAIALAHQHGCDLFIAFDGEQLSQPLCRRLASVCGRALLWVTEDPYEVLVNKANAPLFDLIFTNDSACVSEYGGKGRHLPLAGALEFHDIPVLAADKPLSYELFFAGTAWPNRAEFARSVLHDMPGHWRFKLALPVNEHLPPRNVDLPDSLISWRTSPPDFGRFVNRSAVTILLPRVFSTSGDRQFAETPPPRLFEAALAGGVQLVQEALAEAAHAFTPDREIVLFSDHRDFFHKAAALIDDRERRNRIATAARERALRDHTYDQRVASMLGEISASPPIMRSNAPDLASVDHDMNSPSPRKTVLLVCHNFIGRGDFGGIEVYLDHLRQALADEFNVLFYVRGGPGERKQTLLLTADYTILKRQQFSDVAGMEMLSSPERERAFYSLLLEHRIDLVHFHHFMGHVPALVHIARALGVPTALTFHDYTTVCNEFQLISFDGRFCGAPDVSLAQCDLCLWKKHQIIPGSQAARRGFWNGVLGATDLLIFNTPGAHQLVSSIYPAVRQHAGVKILPVPIRDDSSASHALSKCSPDDPPGGTDREGNAVLRVALLGNVTKGKGGDLIAPLLAALAGTTVEFHLFGRLDSAYSFLANGRMYPNTVIHGAYLPDALPAALLQCDVSLHMSIWPETYCLTLSEAWQIGLVPIVADIGALGERVEHGVNGLKVKPNAAGELINAVRLLAEDRHLLAKLRSNLSRALYETLTPHAAALAEAYRGLFLALPHGTDAILARRAPDIADLGILLQSPSWLQEGAAPHILIGDRSSSGPRVGGTWKGLPRTRSLDFRLLAQLRSVHAFYADHGVRQTTRLLVRRAKRILWER